MNGVASSMSYIIFLSQLLRDNLTLWTSDAAGDGEEGGTADAPEAS